MTTKAPRPRPQQTELAMMGRSQFPGPGGAGTGAASATCGGGADAPDPDAVREACVDVRPRPLCPLLLLPLVYGTFLPPRFRTEFRDGHCELKCPQP